mgnify:CR=1 FL=1
MRVLPFISWRSARDDPKLHQHLDRMESSSTRQLKIPEPRVQLFPKVHPNVLRSSSRRVILELILIKKPWFYTIWTKTESMKNANSSKKPRKCAKSKKLRKLKRWHHQSRKNSKILNLKIVRWVINLNLAKKTNKVKKMKWSKTKFKIEIHKDN